jgi:hypothetical protein
MHLTPKLKIVNHQLPLAIYREVAAHLQQVEGITVTCLDQIDREFSYLDSQVGGLEILGADRLSDLDKARFEDLLNYYADRYSPWDIEI